jgi:hypothetical protein
VSSRLEQIIRCALQIGDCSLYVAKLLARARPGEARREIIRIEAGQPNDYFRGALEVTAGAALLVNRGEMRTRVRYVLLTRGDLGQIEQRVFVVDGDRQDSPVRHGCLRKKAARAQAIRDLGEVLESALGGAGTKVQIAEQSGRRDVVGTLTHNLLVLCGRLFEFADAQELFRLAKSGLAVKRHHWSGSI